MKKFDLCAFADEADSSLDGQILALHDNSIKYLEIRGVDGVNVSEFSAGRAKQIRERLDRESIVVWSVGSPCGKISVCDDFESHLDMFKRTLETAIILGAKAFRLFSFYIPENKNPSDYTDEVLTRLEAFVCTAKGSGVVLCHENEKGIYGDIASRCAVIHRVLPELRAVFDSANFVQTGEDVLKAFELLEPYVYYMHIKDAEKNGVIVEAGCGDGAIPALLEKYRGNILTAEPHLYEFGGLNLLEREGDKSGITNRYKSQREAFDAGIRAILRIINK